MIERETLLTVIERECADREIDEERLDDFTRLTLEVIEERLGEIEARLDRRGRR